MPGSGIGILRNYNKIKYLLGKILWMRLLFGVNISYTILESNFKQGTTHGKQDQSKFAGIYSDSNKCQS